NYIDGILSFYRSEHILNKEFETVPIKEIIKDIKKIYEVEEGIEIIYPEDCILKKVNKAALSQIFLNLVSNALKYNNKAIRTVEITCEETSGWYSFEVIDNGDGFDKKNSAKIFELFTTLETEDRRGNPGSGIGLATVKKLVENLGGSIGVNSTPGEGSRFTFTIKRI
ncbi:MAG: ATP-binding protein, partial [Gillisia sp.]